MCKHSCFFTIFVAYILYLCELYQERTKENNSLPLLNCRYALLPTLLRRHDYYFDELSVLDLFAGTGNISYEFASRGCPAVIAIDSHSGCVQFISKTARELDYPITALKADVYEYLKRTSQQFDVVFADPPYEFPAEKFAAIAELVFDNALLRPNGTLIIEHSTRTDLSELPHFVVAKRYGGCVFSFFEP